MISPDRILAMQQAIKERNLKKVLLFLKAGVPAHYVYDPSRQRSLLNLAAETGDLPIFQSLLEAGADITFPGGFLGSMIHCAVCSKSSSPEIVGMVLKEGHCKQSDLDSTLLYAPQYASLEIVELLLQAGANPRYLDEDKASALMHAVMNKQNAIAIRLVEAGADVTVRIPYEEHYKKTVIELAAIYEMHDLLQICHNKPSVAKSDSNPVVQLETLADCLHAIKSWFRKSYPKLRLGKTKTVTALPEPFNSSPIAETIRTLFSTWNGSNDMGIIPMPAGTDVSYSLLTLVDAFQERDMMLDLRVQENAGAKSAVNDWSSNWLPFATNGGGDYLICDCNTGEIKHFSHETRLTTTRAASLFELFHDIALGLQTGKYQLSSSRGIA